MHESGVHSLRPGSVPDPFVGLGNDALGLVLGRCGVRDVMALALSSDSLCKRIQHLILTGKLPQVFKPELEVSCRQYSWIAEKHPTLKRRLGRTEHPLKLLENSWRLAELLSGAAIADALFERSHGLKSQELRWALRLACCVPAVIEQRLTALLNELSPELEEGSWQHLEGATSRLWFCTPHGNTELMLRARAQDWAWLRDGLRLTRHEVLFKGNDEGDTLLTTLLAEYTVENRETVIPFCQEILKILKQAQQSSTPCVEHETPKENYDKALALACYHREWDLAQELLNLGADASCVMPIKDVSRFCAAAALLRGEPNCEAKESFRLQCRSALLTCFERPSRGALVMTVASEAPELFLGALAELDPEQGYYSPVKRCKEYPIQLLASLELAGHGDKILAVLDQFCTAEVDINACYPQKGSQPLLHQLLAAHDNEGRSTETLIEALLQRPGMRVDQRDHAGLTAAVLAAGSDNFAPVLRRLLDAGADPAQLHPASQRSLLHVACKSGAPVNMRLLLQKLEGDAKVRLQKQADAHGLSPALYSFFFRTQEEQQWVALILKKDLELMSLYRALYPDAGDAACLMRRIAAAAVEQYRQQGQTQIGAFHMGVMPQAFFAGLQELNLPHEQLLAFLRSVLQNELTVQLWLNQSLRQQEGASEWQRFSTQLNHVLPLHCLWTAGRWTIEHLLEACRPNSLGDESASTLTATERARAWLACDPELRKLRSSERGSLLSFFLDHEGQDGDILAALSAQSSSSERLELFAARLRKVDSPERISALFHSVSPEKTERGSPEFKYSLAAWTVRTCRDEDLSTVLSKKLRQRLVDLIRSAAALAVERAGQQGDVWAVQHLRALSAEKSQGAKRRLNFGGTEASETK